MTDSPGLYVYAVIPGSLPALALGTGIDDVPLKLVAAGGGPAAVVHEHRRAPYSGADDDVQRWILEHSNVVERCWEQAGTVLPMSFNVIVAPGDGMPASARLAQWLAASGPALAGRLDALRERVELRVEISLDQQLAAGDDPEVAALREEMQHRPAGVQRLLRKRLDGMERGIAERLAGRLYPQYRRRLATLSEDLAENRHAHQPPASVSVLNIALLVPRSAVTAIGGELSAIAAEEQAAQIRFLGPWPPYSFADVPELNPG
ncbi:GvpL/GvpF family gas vesicle protein [Arthrobacter sp. I2-34]|uniref:GvpL/GvpF family gas vesicle protein n=1 Tax=Arthrobacter hankyongi TaxID=2904801 RepID=A0ABS9L8B3_9MICC|nr:GvpL/GvpF family gas vesicle protein [Arthrobacter hankyongi]MCG2622758.1 GvpL/GvpF family gas vesicle protein [Arthrobacter hankyongi]